MSNILISLDIKEIKDIDSIEATVLIQSREVWAKKLEENGLKIKYV